MRPSQNKKTTGLLGVTIKADNVSEAMRDLKMHTGVTVSLILEFLGLSAD